MNAHKKKFTLICTFLVLCITVHSTSFAARSSSTTTTTTTTTNTTTNSKTTLKSKSKKDRFYVPHPAHKNWLTKDHINGWGWIGAGLMYASHTLQPYLKRPMVDYEVGLAKTIYHVTPRDFWYLALGLDFAFSHRDLPPNTAGTDFFAAYYLYNVSLLGGYEQSLGTPYVSAFVEIGPALQERSFLLAANVSTIASDYSFDATFGGTFNLGFNFKIVPERPISYMIRIAMTMMIGIPETATLNYNGDNANFNPRVFAPSLAFAVRM